MWTGLKVVMLKTDDKKFKFHDNKETKTASEISMKVLCEIIWAPSNSQPLLWQTDKTFLIVLITSHFLYGPTA